MENTMEKFVKLSEDEQLQIIEYAAKLLEEQFTEHRRKG